jgi:hypothetical protein
MQFELFQPFAVCLLDQPQATQSYLENESQLN